MNKIRHIIFRKDRSGNWYKGGCLDLEVSEQPENEFRKWVGKYGLLNSVYVLMERKSDPILVGEVMERNLQVVSTQDVGL